jgi:Cd2+/Zn2+-exporting ATPase
MAATSPSAVSAEARTESIFGVEGLCCHEEAALLEKRLRGLKGVHLIAPDLVGAKLRVTHDPALAPASAIAEEVAHAGMRAWLLEEGARGKPVDHAAARRLALLAGSGILLVAGTALHLRGAAPAWQTGLLGGAVVAGGLFTVRRAVAALRALTLDINVLMTVAVIGAMVLGEWVEAATVVFLFALSQWLEARSMERARRAIGTLVDQAPSEVMLRRDGADQRVAADRVAVGDIMIVRAGERIALDGEVVAGDTDVNQAPVTGESLPVPKGAGDHVFAGSINGHGALEVRVSRLRKDSTIARIIRLVEQAQAQRAPAQAFVDRFARVYTPAVIALAAALAVVPPLAAGASWSEWVYRALVLLVISCPCALVISTPVSIVSGLASAARHGVLVKGGLHLERTGDVRCVAFDKTGTLTRGELAVRDVVPLDGSGAAEVVRLAAAIEARSEHPIGRAIVRHADRQGIDAEPASAFRALPGRGAEAHVDGRPVLLGNHRLFEERGLCADHLHGVLDQLEALGRTTVMLAREGRAVGVIGVADDLRARGVEALGELRRHGVAQVVMLTGDSRITATAIARDVGIDEVHAELLPEDKVRVVRSLRERYGTVAMIGDGVNDAPALAAADVGIAMGAAGSDAALETADVALMSDELTKVPYLLRLGSATLRTIKANIAFAIGVKAVFLAMAVAGQATLWMAVLADTGASLVVVANGLRLLRAR